MSHLKNIRYESVYIFGGWHGLLSTMVSDNLDCGHIFSIDSNPLCVSIGPELTGDDPKITFITADMGEYNYSSAPSLVINTSTEHVTQETYDAWYAKIPVGTHVALQGCNLVHPQHIRTSSTLTAFFLMNCPEMGDGFLDVLDVGFERHMAIFEKLR